MADETTLKPCPFCGNGDITLVTLWRDEKVYYADCSACHVETPYLTRDDTIALWQARPVEDALRARIAALEAALKPLHDAGWKGWMGRDEVGDVYPAHIYVTVGDIRAARRALGER